MYNVYINSVPYRLPKSVIIVLTASVAESIKQRPGVRPSVRLFICLSVSYFSNVNAVITTAYAPSDSQGSSTTGERDQRMFRIICLRAMYYI